LTKKHNKLSETTLNDEIINQAKHLVEFLNKKANKYKPYIMKW